MPDANRNLMTVFAEALERTDPAARAAYLDMACRDDAALRERVEALLAAHEGAGRFLEPDSCAMSETAVPETEGAQGNSAPETRQSSRLVNEEQRPDGPTTTIADPERTDRPSGFVTGQVIAGRYTLLEVLGEGGMGTVYRAGQTEPVKRQVALKLIKVGMDSRAVLARFDAERQALALMDHPNIARVYDGGTSAAGQPFFVMELVNGVPITDYCDRHRLPVQARVELFVSVCQAVQHAHQKGIIHRDLKPGNVLVTEVDGRPTAKVIDFGVAKATEFKLTDQSVVDAGAIVGTPSYMSPEQADPSSVDIDTRTDVYALGVILYELLAGSLPVEVKQLQRGAFLEMLRMVREIDPPRPSTKVSSSDTLPSIAANRNIDPEHLKRALRGDLDWIVMKALEKDRARRYETANGFAADILRHLAHEPVLAAPPSRAYRLRKFVRKHRGAVVAGSLVVIALLAGIAGTTWGLFRADRRRAEAEKARSAEAERVKERDAALGKANDAKRTADSRAEELKYRLGVNEMVLASTAYEKGDVALAADRLDNVPPEQHGWEWHYLKRLTRGGLFALYGHAGAVSSVSFSPDGTRILTSSDDDTVRLWDASSGTSLLKLDVSANGAKFSPDGTRVLTGGEDQTARLWDARSGAPLLELKGHTGAVMGVAFSPDGTRIVTWGGVENKSGEARVWDARTGMPLLELKGHTYSVMSAAFSPDGTRIVTGGGGEYPAPAEVKVWDARTGTHLLDLKGHTQQIQSVAFSPDGMRIVTGSEDQTARVWEARSGVHLLELRGHTDGVRSVAFSPDGMRILTGSVDQTAKVWDARSGVPPLELREARSGVPPLELRGHAKMVTSVAFSPDGTRIVTSSWDETAKVWDAETGMILLYLKAYNNRVRASAAFSPDGTRIVTSGASNYPEPGQAKVWDARTGRHLLDLKGHATDVASAAFSPNGTRIVTFGGGQYPASAEAKVWDARTGTHLLDLKGHTQQIQSVAFSPDGMRIVTGSEDQTARVWEARSGVHLFELRGHMGEVRSVAFSPDGNRIVTGGGPGLLAVPGDAKVWDALSGVQLLELRGLTDDVNSVAFSPDGTRIVTGGGVWGERGEVRLWDARTGTPLIELKNHNNEVMSVAFSPDGMRIVTGSADQMAQVWDARPSTPPMELRGHTDRVTIASFSPDGTRIVTGGGGEEVRLWDARTGTALIELKNHNNEVMSVAFSPDGMRIAASDSDGSVKVWDARSGTGLFELRDQSCWISIASFSPDGTRIVTGSEDAMARIWDALTGSPLLELKGHAGHVTSASYTADGTRIFGKIDYRTPIVWDARNGQELKDGPIPPTPWDGQISPDGRWIAHILRDRVQLVPLQPDEEELSYRRIMMQPNYGLYREAYDAATKANDEFAARFYLNLFPPPERALIRAETIVTSLFDRLLLRDDVLAALKAQPAADPEIQAASLKLAGIWPESANECNIVAWPLVSDPGRADTNYQRGLRLAQAACRLKPENGLYLNTLGVAQYRIGLMAEALATLTRSNELNKERLPADLAFLALAQHGLGQSEKARDTLGRLREVMKSPEWARDPAAQAFLHEAETIELDWVFPADPFAH
jgi:WD40 repeat protein/serine/threonine protein kinase